MSNDKGSGGKNEARPRNGPTQDLQERTLRVTNFGQKVTKELLYELFTQVGPVVNVVHKPDFAFIEFEDAKSVAYALAAMDGVSLHGDVLHLQPKLPTEETFFYVNQLRYYEQSVACNPNAWLSKFGAPGRAMPRNLCRDAQRRLGSLPDLRSLEFVNQSYPGSNNYGNQSVYQPHHHLYHHHNQNHHHHQAHSDVAFHHQSPYPPNYYPQQRAFYPNHVHQPHANVSNYYEQQRPTAHRHSFENQRQSRSHPRHEPSSDYDRNRNRLRRSN